MDRILDSKESKVGFRELVRLLEEGTDPWQKLLDRKENFRLLQLWVFQVTGKSPYYRSI